MSVVVLGTITRDTLVYPGESAVESLGGLLYETVALASLSEDLIIPVANVGSDIFQEVVSLLSEYPNVSLEGLTRIDQPNYHVFLCYFTEFGCQIDRHLLPPISFKQVKPFLNGSFMLVAFISGFDVNLSTLRTIAKRATCPIYLDYHCLAWDIDIENNRFLRRRRNWLDWASAANVVQFNSLEARLVWQRPVDTDSEMLRFGRTILDTGSQAVIITLGAAGSAVVYRHGESCRLQRIHAQPVASLVDTTGCGAVYSAGFITHYLRSSDIPAACAFASTAASKKCTVSGIAGLRRALSSLRSTVHLRSTRC